MSQRERSRTEELGGGKGNVSIDDGIEDGLLPPFYLEREGLKVMSWDLSSLAVAMSRHGVRECCAALLVARQQNLAGTHRQPSFHLPQASAGSNVPPALQFPQLLDVETALLHGHGKASHGPRESLVVPVLSVGVAVDDA